MQYLLNNNQIYNTFNYLLSCLTTDTQSTLLVKCAILYIRDKLFAAMCL